MSSVTFVNGLYIQTSLSVNCLPATSDRYYHVRKNDGLEIYLFIFIFFLFSHPGDSVSLTGVCESGSISGRLPDDLEGSHVWQHGSYISMHKQNFIKIHSLFLKTEILTSIKGHNSVEKFRKISCHNTIHEIFSWAQIGRSAIFGREIGVPDREIFSREKYSRLVSKIIYLHHRRSL